MATTQIIPHKPLQKVTETARQLNVSRQFLYQLMDAGKLRYIQIGGTRRLRPEDVERFLAESTRG
jgi:excisionase family DNA binding protein